MRPGSSWSEIFSLFLQSPSPRAVQRVIHIEIPGHPSKSRKHMHHPRAMLRDMLLAAAVCTALAAVCKLIGPDLINAVLPAVTGLASHSKDLVRKKAVMALQRFQQLDPKHEGQLSGADLDSYYRQALCDKVSTP